LSQRVDEGKPLAHGACAEKGWVCGRFDGVFRRSDEHGVLTTCAARGARLPSLLTLKPDPNPAGGGDESSSNGA
jgi:hypothetical protein